MRELINNLPTQILDTLNNVQSQPYAITLQNIANVVVSGMGGSGISGRIFSQIFEEELSVPVGFANSYSVPGFINSNTLFIACSYSGNTEETIAATLKAKQKKAYIVCISTGGILSEMAKENNWPILIIEGGKPPRSQFGAAFSALLKTFVEAKLVQQKHLEDLKRIAQVLEQTKSELEDTAAFLAQELVETIPIIYAPCNLEFVALRFRQQLNENSKMLCWHSVLPEMNHNEIVAWELADEFLKPVFIRSDDETPQMKTRFEVTRDIVSEQTDLVEIKPEGSTELEKAFYLIYLFDWVSLHLAELNHVDPMSIKNIDFLKNALQKLK